MDVDRGENAALDQLAVEVDLHVAGALELLEDHVVHPRTGVDESGSYDGQAAALFDVPRRTKEPLGLLQGVGVNTARKHLSGGRDDGVVSTCETGDGVKQNHDVAFVFDQALGFIDHHLGDLYVAGGGLVEG